MLKGEDGHGDLSTKEQKEGVEEVGNEIQTRERSPTNLQLRNLNSTELSEDAQQSSGTRSPSSSAGSNHVWKWTPRKYELETDVSILERRRKQIEYGKFTQDYVAYSRAVPRKQRLPEHPRTPNQNRAYSRRAWDGLVKDWRVALHNWNNLEALKLEKQRRKELNYPFNLEATSAEEENLKATSAEEENLKATSAEEENLEADSDSGLNATVKPE